MSYKLQLACLYDSLFALEKIVPKMFQGIFTTVFVKHACHLTGFWKSYLMCRIFEFCLPELPQSTEGVQEVKCDCDDDVLGAGASWKRSG